MICDLERDGVVCGATEGVKNYLTGRRCPACSPAALAGRPVPVPDPAATAEALRPARVAPAPRQIVKTGRYAVEVARAELGLPPFPGAPPPEQPKPPAVLCPGCHRDPVQHGAHCPMGPRARFAFAPGGRILGTSKCGPTFTRGDQLHAWLRKLSGRCSWCACHPPTQGHLEGCPVLQEDP